MTAAEAGPSQPPELERVIEDGIAQRTKVRIQTLQVEVIGDRVVIRGCVPSYYMKQLVLQGVLDVVDSARATQLELNIQVMC
jgi:hypothetical protein